nr:MAG TPA: hypothetical protein [Caudoviricetes sp.]
MIISYITVGCLFYSFLNSFVTSEFLPFINRKKLTLQKYI